MANEVFSDYLYKFLVCYFDDCAVASDTFEEHLVHLRKTFEALDRQNLVIKGSKCQFGLSEIQFHGFLVSNQTVAHLPKRQVTVFEVPRPLTPKKMHAFLGLSNYFHSFVPGYSLIRQPLNAMVNEKKMIWSPIRYNAFYALKDAIRAIPRLFHVTYRHPIYLDVDASLKGFMGYLFQLSTSHISGHKPVDPYSLLPSEYRYHQPLEFVSHCFANAQAKWANPVREIYAMCYCMYALKHIIQSAYFVVRTFNVSEVKIDISCIEIFSTSSKGSMRS
jgi:hypothetical protein